VLSVGESRHFLTKEWQIGQASFTIPPKDASRLVGV
jgi:hypothetical protein